MTQMWTHDLLITAQSLRSCKTPATDFNLLQKTPAIDFKLF